MPQQSLPSSSSSYESALSSDYDDLASDALFDKTELSATQLVDSTELFVRWELLHGCQEAAFEDIPSKYKDCLMIFDEEATLYLVNSSIYEGESQYDALFALAGAVKTNDPWSLPAPIYDLSDDDALSPLNLQVLAISQVQPTAASFTPLDKGQSQHQMINSDPLPATSSMFHEYASPLVHPKHPVIASAVFISADIFGFKKPPFEVMRRYNRLATTSLLREACSLHIDVPVVGILLRDNLAALHVDWYEETTEAVFNSAFIPSQPEEMDIRTWDLNQPQEAHALASILANLKKYTLGPFASLINDSLTSCSLSVKPWKWNKSVLPSLGSPFYLLQHLETSTSEDKVVHWKNRLPEFSNSSNKSWVKQKLVVHRTNILSPPSTPGDH